MFIFEKDIRSRAHRRTRKEGVEASGILSRVSQTPQPHYDIFLSQTIRDAELVLGVYDLLTELGYKVFCDWIQNPMNDRSQVSPANAKYIRAIMTVSDSMLFLDTEGADQSLWMCWELGWFDGRKGPVAVLPILQDGKEYYRGREFLGLYPYVELDDEGHLKIVRPVVSSPNGTYIIEAPNYRSYKNWVRNSPDFVRPRTPGF
ncbi:hypothetical protein [Pseudomonas sp. W15Feb9B]|uniref:hypothetical protein n=1 Tax=Pseudomonas sp. W15Feb9B TaxID=550743 RepID=UPI000697F210|nr:hypothetical protein [Pseudomonas sp. W15Feb9B]